MGGHAANGLSARVASLEFLAAEADVRQIGRQVAGLAEAFVWSDAEVAAAGADATHLARVWAQQERLWRQQELTDDQIVERQAARSGLSVEAYQRQRALVAELIGAGVPLSAIVRRLEEEAT